MSQHQKKVDPLTLATQPASELSSSPQALKSERTRAALLRAAEVIFARDGFEASRIEDIAAEAGRSRGAFYANFDNKTEVFLALRTIATRRIARAIRERVESLHDDTARYSAIIRYILEQICDTQTQLLQIEFKLFAIRHPDILAELSAKHFEASTSVNRQELSDLFPKKKESTAKMRRTTLAIEAVLEGFSLNARFSPQDMDPRHLKQLIPDLLARILRHD
jgi:AcrR family transcriptional regulator